ncbi:hypothetical protein FOA52_011643 [Chlamydomonas sp. UWO 241]|nr:hypothetical protein FOA52_011643 [Chlamydomonas sp. UWO 241]
MASSGRAGGLFPNFRERFFIACTQEGGSAGEVSYGSNEEDARRVAAVGEEEPEVSPGVGSSTVSGLRLSSSQRLAPSLKTLDLAALPRDDGPISETQVRREKYQFFEKQCSNIADGLYLSGDLVARSRETLRASGITHVLNCVGFICKEYFVDEGLIYRTYYLQDTPGEDILSVLYDALEFVDGAIKSGGHVLVHCSQGVSRSATLVIAYLMWQTGGSYDEVFARVKARRGVTNPNIGFTCQLLQWQKRRNEIPVSGPRLRVLRISPHAVQTPGLLLARPVAPPPGAAVTWRQLDFRGAFLVHAPGRIYLWIGKLCPPDMAAAGRFHAKLLLKFEDTGLLGARRRSSEAGASGPRTPVVEVKQGREPSELKALLDPRPISDDMAGLSLPSHRSLETCSDLDDELASSVDVAQPAGEAPDPMQIEPVDLFGTLASPALSQHSHTRSGSSEAALLKASGLGPSASTSSRGGGGGAHSSGRPSRLGAASLLSPQREASGSGAGSREEKAWAVGTCDEYSRDFQLYADHAHAVAVGPRNPDGSAGSGNTHTPGTSVEASAAAAAAASVAAGARVPVLSLHASIGDGARMGLNTKR